MAIYKPTDCSPSSYPIDLQDIINGEPYYFYCKIQSSNVQSSLSVSGYTIEIYDEDGELVFPTETVKLSDRISIINDLNSESLNIDPENYKNLNSGINGTYLKIPVLTNSKAENTVGRNQILITNLEGGIIKNNKNYTWTITLYQGVSKNDNGDVIVPAYDSPIFFDMPVTSGYTLGSYHKRIQSKISENIYPNYFIQPVLLQDESSNINCLSETAYPSHFDKSTNTIVWGEGNNKINSITPVGKRVPIISYDYEFGHIYPASGINGLSTDQVGNFSYRAGVANAFCIYKNSNDPSLFSIYNKVTRYADFLAGTITQEIISSNSGLKIFKQEFDILKQDFDRLGSNEFPFYVNSTKNYDGGVVWDPEENGNKIIINKNDRVLFGKMHNSEEKTSYQSENNGIYSVLDKSGFVYNYEEYNPYNSYQQGAHVRYNGKDYTAKTNVGPKQTNQGTEPTNDDYWKFEGLSGGKIILTWARTADANTWGSLITKVVLCEENLVVYQFAKYNDDGKILINSNNVGKINQDAVVVLMEQPIVLWGDLNYIAVQSETEEIEYSNEYLQSIYSKIFYNESSILYISPFERIDKGMALFSKNFTFDVGDFDKEYYKLYLTYHVWVYQSEKYEIKTFFRKSDENLFSTMEKPTIEFYFWNKERTKPIPGAGSQTITPVEFDNFYVHFLYKHNRYVSWEKYQWDFFVINEATGEEILIQQYGPNYSGSSGQYFQMVFPGGLYLLKLTMKLKNGMSIVEKRYIRASFTLYSNPNKYIEINLKFNYCSNSIDIEATNPNELLYAYNKFSIYKREKWVGGQEPSYSLVAQDIFLDGGQKKFTIVRDYNVSNGRKYEYLVGDLTRNQSWPAGDLLPKGEVVQLKSLIETNWDFWSITELHPTQDPKIFNASDNDVWLFKYNVIANEQVQNLSKTQQNNLSVFPKFSKGRLNNISSSITALIGQEMVPYKKEGSYREGSLFLKQISSNEATDLLDKWRKICYSGNPKLLKDMKGQKFLIQITDSSNNINYTWNQMPNAITFSWVQIGDSKDVQIYETHYETRQE